MAGVVKVKCPKCQQVLSVREEDRGRKVKCGSCQAVFALRAKAAPKQAKPPADDEADAELTDLVALIDREVERLEKIRAKIGAS